MDWVINPNIWISLLTLTAMEIVLGIDNVIFISIVAGKLPAHRQPAARRIGLSLAVISRLVFLSCVFWLTQLTSPLVTIFRNEVSVRDLILILGGLFLLAKATYEIHSSMEKDHEQSHTVAKTSFAAVIAQILVLDIVFSLDSVITAIGMAEHLAVMAVAVVIAIGFMMLFAGPVSDFVHRHPSVKMLALSFLLLIGLALVAEGWDLHIPKGYLYFAMGFSFFVEMLNMQLRKRGVPSSERSTTKS